MAENGDAGFAAVRELILGRARDDLPRTAGLYAALTDAQSGAGGARRTVRLTELFDRLVAYRNREIGHGATGQRPAEFYRRMGQALLTGLAPVLAQLDVLAGRRLIYVGDVRRLASGAWLIERYELVSESPRRLESLQLPDAETAHLPRPERIYLESGTDARVPVPFPTLRSLSPLLQYDPDGNKVFFLNAQRGQQQIEYLCYSTGEVQNRESDGDEFMALLAHVLGRPVDAAAVGAWAAQSLAEEPSKDHSALDSAETPAASAPAPRAIGEFELLSRLGHGGMGVVYRAWQPSLGRQVALKCMLRSGDPKADARFAREIRALGRVEHPNVVKVFTSGAEGEHWFSAMELIEGAELVRICEQFTGSSATDVDESRWRQALTRACELARSQEKPLSKSSTGSDPRGKAASAVPHAPPSDSHSTPPQIGHNHVRQVVEIVRQVAEAAHVLHEAGVIHRDIKPGNIMLTADGAHPVLMDLGLAQLADETAGRVTRTRQFVGTLRYASPEQVLAAGRVDHRTDIYSLGATLWELLALRPIYDANDETPTPDLMLKIQTTDPDSPRKHNRHVPRDLEAFVMKCLEKDRARRYPTALDLAADLGRYLRGEPVSAQPPSFAYLTGKFVRRHKRVLGSAAAVFLLVVVGTILAFAQILTDRNRARNESNRANQAEDDMRIARNRAQTNFELADKGFAQARGSINDLLREVSETRLKHLPGMRVIRRELAEKVVEKYRALAALRPDDETIQDDLAQAYLQLGIAAGRLRTVDEAVRAFREAEALQTALAKKRPDSLEPRHALAEIRLELAEMYLWNDDRDKVKEPAEKALAIAKAVVAAAPDKAAYRVVLARLYNRVGSMSEDKRDVEKGRRQENECYQESLRLWDELIDREPNNAMYRYRASLPRNNLGIYYNDTKKYEDALEAYATAERSVEKALAQNPQNPEWRSMLSLVRANKARTLINLRKDQKAVAVLMQAVDTSESLVNLDPGELRYTRQLASARTSLADLHQRLGKRDAAVANYEVALKAQEVIARQFKYGLDSVKRVVYLYNQIASLEVERKKHDEAAKVWERGLTFCETVLTNRPGDAHVLMLQVDFRAKLAGRAEGDNKYAIALTHYEAGLAIWTGQLLPAKSFPDRELFLDEYLRLCSSASRCASKAGEEATAERILREAESLARKGNARKDKVRLAAVQMDRGRVHFRAKRYKQARASFRQAVDLLQPLYEQAPWHTFVAVTLAEANRGLSLAHRALAEVEPRIAAANRYLRIASRLDNKDYAKGLKLSERPSQKEADQLVSLFYKVSGWPITRVSCHWKNGKTTLMRSIYVVEPEKGTDSLETQARILREEHDLEIDEAYRVWFRTLYQHALKNKIGLNKVRSPDFKLQWEQIDPLNQPASNVAKKARDEKGPLNDALLKEAERDAGNLDAQEALARAIIDDWIDCEDDDFPKDFPHARILDMCQRWRLVCERGLSIRPAHLRLSLFLAKAHLGIGRSLSRLQKPNADSHFDRAYNTLVLSFRDGAKNHEVCAALGDVLLERGKWLTSQKRMDEGLAEFSRAEVFYRVAADLAPDQPKYKIKAFRDIERAQFSSVTADHRLSALPQPSPVPSMIVRNAATRADEFTRIIILVYGTMVTGEPFWCYVAVKPSKYKDFLKTQESGALDLYAFEPFGEVIISGVGDEPPDEVTKKVAEVYNTHPANFFQPMDGVAQVQRRAERVQQDFSRRAQVTAAELSRAADDFRVLTDGFLEKGDLKKAFEYANKEVLLWDRIVKDGSGGEQSKHALRAAALRAGRLALRLGRSSETNWLHRAESLGSAEAAFALAEHFEKAKNESKFTRDLAQTHRSTGHYLKGLESWEAKRYADALVDFKKAVEANPAYDDAHAQMGACLVKLRRWDEAIVSLRRAFDLQPEKPSAAARLLDLLEAMLCANRWSDALQLYRSLENKGWKLKDQGPVSFSTETLFYGFRVLALDCLGEDNPAARRQLAQMLDQPNRRIRGWDWSELDHWLRSSKLPEARRSAVRKTIDSLKSPAKELTAAYYPLKPGAVWKYQSSVGGSVVVRVVRRELVADRDYYRLEISEAGATRVEHVAVEADGVHRLPAGALPSDSPVKILALPRKAGGVWPIETRSGQLPIKGRGVVRIQDVTVPAGRFANAVIVEQRVRVGNSDTSETITTWYVEGIGPVKQVTIRGLKLVAWELDKYVPSSSANSGTPHSSRPEIAHEHQSRR